MPRGGCVALLGATTPEFLAVFRGAVWSGRYFTAMSWRWTAQDVAYVAGNCEAGALFADARLVHLPVHASWLNQIEIVFSIIRVAPVDAGEVGPDSQLDCACGLYLNNPTAWLPDAPMN